MQVYRESGVLPTSQRFFATPSPTARRVLFYVTRCGRYEYDEHFFFQDDCSVARLDSHRNFFLLYLQSGRMHFRLQDTAFTLQAGQLALVDCRAPHAFFTSGPAASLWLHFDGALAPAFFKEILSLRDRRQSFDLPSESSIPAQMDAIIDAVASGSTPEIALSQQLYEILCTLLQPQQSDRTTDPVAAAMAYVQAHLAQPISVPQLAAAVNLSASHFSRLFRTATGLSPHEYIILRRIDAAKQLLLTTDLTIKEIACRTGYRSEVNFIVSFTKKVGLSPTAFRTKQ